MTVGDIHWVQLPAANGHEQRGRRPAVVFQDDAYAGGLPVVLVVPLTTSRGAMRFAGTVLIRPAPENGLLQASVALVFQLRAIDRRRVQEPIGRVSPAVLQEMFTELDKLTGRAQWPV
jgi:mRNA interferase MazF